MSGSGKIDEYKSQTKRDEKYHQSLVQYDISGFNFTHQTHSIENLTTGRSISLASSFDDLLGSACDQCPTKHKAISQIRRKKYLLNFSIQLCFFLFQFADFFLELNNLGFIQVAVFAIVVCYGLVSLICWL